MASSTNLKEDQPIVVDRTDYDSSLDTSASEYSTQSLQSSIYEYRYENGRRYHAYQDGAYVLPNDESEQDRLDIVHHICLLMNDGKLHIAPIGGNPQMILDVGTGTGIWAIDCGEHFPSAKVIGTDLSPIQPSWVPPNVEFQIDDAESDWTWPKNHFDMVHIRHLGGTIKDWPKLLRQAYRALKPGGWIDICEYEMNLFSDNGTYHDKLNMWRYYDLVNEAAEKIGSGFTLGAKLKPLMADAKFENVERRTLKMPLGTWPADPKLKEIGAFFALTAETGFEAFGLALLTRVLGMELEVVKELIDQSKKEVKSRKVHAYAKQYFYCGQKPEDDS